MNPMMKVAEFQAIKLISDLRRIDRDMLNAILHTLRGERPENDSDASMKRDAIHTYELVLQFANQAHERLRSEKEMVADAMRAMAERIEKGDL